MYKNNLLFIIERGWVNWQCVKMSPLSIDLTLITSFLLQDDGVCYVTLSICQTGCWLLYCKMVYIFICMCSMAILKSTMIIYISSFVVH